MRRRKIFGLLLLGVIAGCSDNNSNSDPDSSMEPSESPGVHKDPTPSAGCGNMAAAGTTDGMLDFAGVARPYRLHIPDSYADEPLPLVINMHGFLSNQMQQEQLSLMTPVADDKNFIVVYPGGAGSPVSWNAGDCCAFSEPDRDDVGFIGALLDEITSSVCVDERRIYATGMSNGGFMTHLLACYLSERIAAFASVAGVLGIDPAQCKPSRAVPVMQFHGTADPLVPYSGGEPNATYWSFLYPGETPPTFRSAPETIDFWRMHDGCGNKSTQTYQQGNATCDTYGNCDEDAEVTFCTLDGSGHTWPGGDIEGLAAGAGATVTAIVGTTSMDINASAAMWDFFEKHPLPN